ncbi:MAG: hypothetical protein HRU43_05115 [Simkaniaceae bacterium]|nr:hypothetical protein [Simkaniaceae bacterium]
MNLITAKIKNGNTIKLTKSQVRGLQSIMECNQKGWIISVNKGTADALILRDLIKRNTRTNEPTTFNPKLPAAWLTSKGCEVLLSLNLISAKSIL